MYVYMYRYIYTHASISMRTSKHLCMVMFQYVKTFIFNLSLSGVSVLCPS
jgi:hypothetical protein